MNDILFIVLICLAIIVPTSLVLFFNLRKKDIDKTQTENIRNLEHRITDLMTNQLKEIRGSVDSTSKSMYNQISSFTKETVQIREEMKQVQDAMKGISSFQEFFKSPKIRGQWGEASLEHVLGQYYPKELFSIQHYFKSGDIADAILKLPNEKIIAIDAKFPFDNFRLMTEDRSHEKKFVEDVKKQITDISNKYILPQEGTIDFAIMYIPAEAVYYEINMIKDVDLAGFAHSKKVILTSPNTIFLALSAIEHWFKDVQIGKKTQDILKRLARIQQDGNKLYDGFRVLGKHLSNAQSSYDDNEKRLTFLTDRVERLLDNDNKQLN